MRKVDYQTLARFIVETLRILGDDTDERAVGERAALHRLARQFAASASVNRDEFLKACGIDP